MEYLIFIVPLTIIVAGYFMYKYPPKRVNWFVGYRTRKSMKDEEIWEIANRYCGKLWLKIGMTMLVISFLIYIFICFKIFVFSETFLTIIILCQVLLLLLLSVLIVENEIKILNESNDKLKSDNLLKNSNL